MKSGGYDRMTITGMMWGLWVVSVAGGRVIWWGGVGGGGGVGVENDGGNALGNTCPDIMSTVAGWVWELLVTCV